MHAPGADDATALTRTATSRALVVALERAASTEGGDVPPGAPSGPGSPPDALVSAWFSLGLELAREGASATLVAAHAAAAPGYARAAALLEGERRGRRELEARAARAAWAPERCLVALGDGRFALVVPPPDMLGEDAAVAHAERCAALLLRRGARVVRLVGDPAGAAVVGPALSSEGFEVEGVLAAAPAAPEAGGAPGPLARLVARLARRPGPRTD